jgi:hypothetical protein
MVNPRNLIPSSASKLLVSQSMHLTPRAPPMSWSMVTLPMTFEPWFFLSSDSARRFAGTWDSRVSARDRDDAHRDDDDDGDDDGGRREVGEEEEEEDATAGTTTEAAVDLRDRDPEATRRTRREGYVIIVVVFVWR